MRQGFVSDLYIFLDTFLMSLVDLLIANTLSFFFNLYFNDQHLTPDISGLDFQSYFIGFDIVNSLRGSW